jgi:hypothetical protein
LAINAGGVVLVYQSTPQHLPARAIPVLNADGAALFILAMVAPIASLTIFLREIFLSIDSPRAPVV